MGIYIVEMLNESVIFRGLLAIMCVGVALILLLNERSVPDWFQVTIGIVVGYFFGSKPIEGAQRAIQRASNGKSEL